MVLRHSVGRRPEHPKGRPADTRTPPGNSGGGPEPDSGPGLHPLRKRRPRTGSKGQNRPIRVLAVTHSDERGGVAYFDALPAAIAGITRLAPGNGAVAFHGSSATLAISSREAPLGRASLWRDL